MSKQKQLIQEVVDATVAGMSVLQMENVHMNAVAFDGDALRTISDIARGLQASAEAASAAAHGLANLGKVLQANNVHVDTMIKVGAR